MAISSDDRRTLLLSGTGLGWLFGAVLGAMFWQDYSHYAILQSPPVRLSLAELLDCKSIAERHVTLTDFTFGDGYAYETGAAAWVSVSVPVFPQQGDDQKTIRAIVESWDIRDFNQLQQVLQRSEVTGVISQKPYWPGATRGPLLEESNPGRNLDKVWGLHIFRIPPNIESIRLTAVGSICCLFAGCVCFAARRRDHKHNRQSKHTDETVP